MREQRYHGLDFLRATMVFLGLLIHAAFPYYYSEPPPTKYIFQNQYSLDLSIMFVFIHLFRMQVFFMVSGFFSALQIEKIGSARPFLLERAQRLIIPFAFFWTLFLPFEKYGDGLLGINSSGFPSLFHLWFLYYLFMMVAFSVTIRQLFLRLVSSQTREKLDKRIRSLIQSDTKFFFLVCISVPLYNLTARGLLPTPKTFIPNLSLLATYMLFFGFGWQLGRFRDLLPQMKRHSWKFTALAFLSAGAFIFYQIKIKFNPSLISQVHFLICFIGAVATWAFALGLFGLFERYLNNENSKIRYVSEASYWCYLMQAPLATHFVPYLFYSLKWGTYPSFFASICIEIPFLLLSYHFFVKESFIGKILKGNLFLNVKMNETDSYKNAA